jgi:pyruvate dehydrogenase E2 component (dihydrolipoamide acetyltransferase)
MVRLIAAIVAGCRSEPALNAAFDGGQVARRMNDAVHVGIAVDTEDGLLVPVLRDAHTLGSDGIQFALDALKTAARTRRATPDTLRGATISLSNFGPIGGLHAALVVVPPQVAILGAGRVVTRVLVEGLGVTEHRTLPLSLTFDHRAVSGGEAARFLAAVKASLETASLP